MLSMWILQSSPLTPSSLDGLLDDDQLIHNEIICYDYLPVSPTLEGEMIPSPERRKKAFEHLQQVLEKDLFFAAIEKKAKNGDSFAQNPFSDETIDALETLRQFAVAQTNAPMSTLASLEGAIPTIISQIISAFSLPTTQQPVRGRKRLPVHAPRGKNRSKTPFECDELAQAINATEPITTRPTGDHTEKIQEKIQGNQTILSLVRSACVNRDHVFGEPRGFHVESSEPNKYLTDWKLPIESTTICQKVSQSSLIMPVSFHEARYCGFRPISVVNISDREGVNQFSLGPNHHITMCYFNPRMSPTQKNAYLKAWSGYSESSSESRFRPDLLVVHDGGLACIGLDPHEPLNPIVPHGTSDLGGIPCHQDIKYPHITLRHNRNLGLPPILSTSLLDEAVRNKPLDASRSLWSWHSGLGSGGNATAYLLRDQELLRCEPKIYRGDGTIVQR